MKINFKKVLPHVVAVAVFLIISCIYFSPVFSDYALNQSDIQQFRGMEKEISDFRLVNEGEEPLWTNSMFGGMPAYQISATYQNNVMSYVDRFIKLGLPSPVSLMFVAMLGFYIFSLCVRVKPWVGIIGAVAFGLSTINILYIGAGHVTKVNAIAYMAPALGGLILAFRGKFLLGSAVFALFFALNVNANHLQMTYYLCFLLGAVALSEGIVLLVKMKFVDLAKVTGVLAIASVLAILPTIGNLLSTNEYGEYTTRGTTELTLKPKGENAKKAVKEGLETNYILDYNYGKRELLSILAPTAKGEKGGYIGNNEAAMESLEGVDGQVVEWIARQMQYWGGQRMSGGAFYFGVIMIVFFIFGLIFSKDNLKWPFLVIGILALLLASNNPTGFNDFFINKFPLYNKFRDSKMILVLLQVMIPALGVIFIDRLFKKEGLLSTKKELLITFAGLIFVVAIFFTGIFALAPLGALIGTIFFYKSDGVFENKKAWLITSAVLSFVAILYYAVPSLSGSFLIKEEVEMFADEVSKTQDPANITFINELKSNLIEVRQGIASADFGRAVMLVILGCGIILLAAYSKISALILTAITFVSVTGDNMSVAKRYLNNEGLDETNTSWVDATNGKTSYLPETADLQILEEEKKSVPSFDSKSKELAAKMEDFVVYKNINTGIIQSIAEFGVLNLNTDYRVLTLGNPFNETNTSYFHKSIGGYHGAKLKHYQEVINFQLSDEMQLIGEAITEVKNQKLREYAVAMNLPQEAAQGVFDTIAVDEINLAETPVLNMLNTKYIILDRTKKAIKNSNALGNAWFVGKIKKVKSSNDEMLGLADLDVKNAAIVNVASDDFGNIVTKDTYVKDSTATIKMTKYRTNILTYESKSSTELPAIFSEIYYPKGWNCYVNGKQVKTFKANYILRGAMIPAGTNKIEWKFEPESYAKAGTIALIGSILLLFLFAFAIGRALMRSLKEEKIELLEN